MSEPRFARKESRYLMGSLLNVPTETMLSTIFLLLLASASVFGAPNATLFARTDGGYARSCLDVGIDSGPRGSDPLLRAVCHDASGKLLLSALKLNQCIANEYVISSIFSNK